MNNYAKPTKFTVKALSAIHTGGDEKTGTQTPFRKKHVQLEVQQKESKFETKTEQHRAFMSLLLEVYKEIKVSLKRNRRYPGYYEPLKGNLLAAAGRSTKWQFLETLLTKCGIKLLRNHKTALEVLNKFSDLELSMFVQSDIQLIMATLQLNIQEKNNWFKELDALKLKAEKLEKQIDDLDDNAADFQEQNAHLTNQHAFLLEEIHKTFTIKDIIVVEDDEKPVFENSIVSVPYITGNSVVGVMRDLLILDFWQRIGLIEVSNEYEIENSLYHMQRTGGVITESTAYEDIDYRIEAIRLCPALGALGTAAGKMTFESGMGVSHLELRCLENGTGSTPSAELLKSVFMTRRDDSKTEVNVKIKGESKGKTAQQMIMFFETLIQGSVLGGEFWFNSFDELTQSCIWRGWELMKEYGKIGGRINRGMGNVDWQIKFPKNASKLYLDHLEKNKVEMLENIADKKTIAA